MDWKESDARKSPKVREIVGRMPPMLASYGIAVIIGSLLMAFFVFAVLPYHPRLSVMVKPTVNADFVQIVSVVVPSDIYHSFPAAFTEVRINQSETDFQLLRVTEIGNDEEGNPLALIELHGETNNTPFDSATMVLHLGKVPLLSWMLGRNYLVKYNKINKTNNFAP